ncbi:protein Wnt-16 [Eurytemora carolleeae]|uniref:protein Wnt-16 n=1 Tax=Eurytemora carolleeae TaxID=1294199 RepID=UPI000C7711CD|nr:protein Wnt-16 [Eurytemora carolleeae]|eukprot:XP_023338432.1 protein Wnt-16-like [Eurytemora affinis]
MNSRMRMMKLLGLYVLSVLLQPAVGSWIQMGMLSSVPGLPDDLEGMQADEGEQTGVCLNMPGLIDQQKKMCTKWPETVQSVPFGTKQGLIECEYQFRRDRWNCTDNRSPQVLQSTLERGSKETAFLYAVTSAGVVHVVAKACSSGNLTECNCDLQGGDTPEGWKWGGCSDNLKYGIKFARKFLDAPDRRMVRKKGDIRNLMNLHNNEAGRRAIAKLMLLKCRCHGVSGSCEFKTCWRSIPQFAEIGDYLKEKYDKSAVQVSNELDESPERDRYRRGTSGGPGSLPVSKKSLVYIQPSPDYCQDDPKAGVVGTRGRRCEKKSRGRDGCGFLCCGRGFDTEVIVEYERCRCKFVWCCRVDCQQCKRKKYIHTCK